MLEERIPAKFRDPDGNWFGFSNRARVIVYNKARVNPADVATYEALADPRNKGKVCTRSGSHPYNLSLIARDDRAPGRSEGRGLGEACRREPRARTRGRRHRPDQGGGGRRVRLAITNTYYYARLMRSTKPEDREIVAKTALVLPDQKATARTSTSPAPVC